MRGFLKGSAKKQNFPLNSKSEQGKNTGFQRVGELKNVSH
jgi:hypothetical protein